MARSAPKTQEAYLHDMLEAARLIQGYMAGVTFEQFWENTEKRDAVSLRLSVLGEAAHRIDPSTEAALPTIPLKVSAAYATVSPMIMAPWISGSSGR